MAGSRSGADLTEPALAALGLTRGEEVRWQAGGGGWRHGTVSRRERDGSIGVVDDDGAARSLAVERVHVGRRGPRGGTGWEPLTTRAARSEQLSLLDDPGSPAQPTGLGRGRRKPRS